MFLTVVKIGLRMSRVVCILRQGSAEIKIGLGQPLIPFFLSATDSTGSIHGQFSIIQKRCNLRLDITDSAVCVCYQSLCCQRRVRHVWSGQIIANSPLVALAAPANVAPPWTSRASQSVHCRGHSSQAWGEGGPQEHLGLALRLDLRAQAVVWSLV